MVVVMCCLWSVEESRLEALKHTDHDRTLESENTTSKKERGCKQIQYVCMHAYKADKPTLNGKCSGKRAQGKKGTQTYRKKTVVEEEVDDITQLPEKRLLLLFSVFTFDQ